jgi:hypothetical protein
MSDDEFRNDGLADVINLLAAPLASGLRTIEQVKRSVDELFRAVDNLNRTLENLNDAAERTNRLLEEVEEPIRAMMPQITRTVRTADEITQRLEGPVRAAAPNIEQMMTTLGSPGFAALPHQLSDFMSAFGEVSKRLAPLAALAENAGGLFGGFKLPGMSAAPRATGAGRGASAVEEPGAESARTPTATRSSAGKSTAKTSTAKKSSAKTSTAKKSSAKKSAAKKSTAKKSTAKKSSNG